MFSLSFSPSLPFIFFSPRRGYRRVTINGVFCQAPAQPRWAELALFLFLHSIAGRSSIASVTSSIAPVTSSIASGTPIQNSSEIAQNQPNLLCNICRSTRIGRQPQFYANGRQPQFIRN
jgi:hypothetical protein